jgi:hypothetical protein
MNGGVLIIVIQHSNNEIANYLCYDKKDFSPYLSNQIFSDFDNCTEFKTHSHKAYAYTYYYLSSYLYFNTKYGEIELDKLSQTNLRVNVLRTVARGKFSYIVKKDGLLDSLGYTKTSTNYPIEVKIEEGIISDFICLKDYKKLYNISFPNHVPNFKIKIPIKCLYASDDETTFDGLQFLKNNVHFIDCSAFILCMDHELLGYNGFYIYGYIRFMSDKFNSGWSASNEKLEKIFGFNIKTIRKYLSVLKEVNLISITKVPYYPNKYFACKKPDLTF